VVLLGACSSSSGAASGSGAAAAAGAAAARAASTTVPSAAASRVGKGLRGRRYCEILLAHAAGGRLSADVYNTYPLNDCPADAWQRLDTKAVAAHEGVQAALRNGPRYWLMDQIDKADSGSPVTKVFGGIAMIREATVDIGTPADLATPYTPHNVTRATVFTFDAGRTIQELVAPDGSTYVMQTWSQQVDGSLGESDLAGLGSRLHVPAGWSYRSRVLTAPLRVVTTTADARVLQDELMNSYSLESAG